MLAVVRHPLVGFTLTIRELHLPRDFKTILTPELQETIERYNPVQVSGPSKSSQTPRKKAIGHALPDTRYGEFTIEADLHNPPPRKPFKVGDRVYTRQGAWKVTEINGEKYMVALDGI